MAEEDAARSRDGRASEPPLVGSRTHEHLRTAFAVEAQAQSLLTYFVLIAEIEGRPDVAQLLQHLAEAHGLHAHGHLDLLTRAADPLASRPMGPTANNLDCVLAAEDQASRELYSPMIKTAAAEGFLDIADWLGTVALAAESQFDHIRRSLAAVAPPPNR